MSVPRVDMRLSYAEYDKAFSGDLRTAQTDLEGRYMLPDDDKIYAVTLHRRDDAAVRRRSPASSSFRASSSKSSACFRTGIRSTGA